MDINIRVAILDDANIANSFLTKLIRDEKKYDTNINDECLVSSLYENLIPNEDNCILVAEVSDVVVGYLYGYIKNNGDAYIDSIAQLEAMYVDVEFRNKGIGSKLIAEFKRWASDKKVRYIELKVCNDNKDAIALYGKNNFINSKSIMMLDLEK